MSILIRNGRVVTATDDYVADVYASDETITTIGTSLSVTADTVIDAAGKLVIPGGIDPHVHLDMPCGRTVSSDDFETGTRAAAFGGTTSIIDFANQTKGRPVREALDEWHERAAGKAAIDYGFHVTITDLPESGLAELDGLADLGITSYKLFMAYPGRLYVDDGVLFRAMRKAADQGAVVMMHAENGIVIDEIVKDAVAAGHVEPRFHALTRPTRMEAEAVHRALAIAEVAGCSLYVVHVSSADALDEIKRARARGVLAHGETCPQYLLLDRSLLALPGQEGAKYVMTPALREASDRAALWRALRMRELATVGTDHCPFWYAREKCADTSDFTRIPNGAPGIENRMSLVYHSGVNEGRFDVNRFVEVTSTAAARLFGLFPRKGTIAVGSDADLVVFDPAREVTISVSNPLTHHMRVDYNAYEGTTVRGYPRVVVSRGRVICRDGEWLGRAGHGRFLERGRSAGVIV